MSVSIIWWIIIIIDIRFSLISLMLLMACRVLCVVAP